MDSLSTGGIHRRDLQRADKIVISPVVRRAYSILSIFKRHGQISRKSEIGKWIFHLASLNQVKTIVEIGTWNGRGSSRLIGSALRDRRRSGEDVLKAIGLEVNQKRAKAAKRYLRRFVDFQVLHGRIVDLNDFDVEDLTESEKIWLEEDLEAMTGTANVLPALPKTIDFLLLDGGEFTTFAEFLKLQNRLTFSIVIDDVFVRKGRKVFEALKSSQDFYLMYLSHERNGTAVFFRNSGIQHD